MSRLFITPRELDFISDITKELIKDVVCQFIVYYPISEVKTSVHGVYDESMQKVFDRPIKLDCLVDNTFQSETKIDSFGVDSKYKLEAYVQHRDLIEKGINLQIGDFFSYGDVFYEVTERLLMRNIYGLPEHKDGIKLVGTKARAGQFDSILQGPTDYSRPDTGAVKVVSSQQRGVPENSEGTTGDVRDMVRSGKLEQPISGPKRTTNGDISEDSSFYEED